MDGIHDLGGMQGFGPVEREGDEPVFHDRWERRAYGLAAAGVLSGTTTSEFRHAIERMDPAHYLTSPYYEHWLTAVATLLVEHGAIDREELERRAGGPFPLARPAAESAGPAAVDAFDSPSPRFAVGDHVRVKDRHPPGHTRCPRYVRGKVGTIVRVDIASALPDVEAHGPDRPMQMTYCVCFDAGELWGYGDGSVHVDLWDSYLEKA